MLTLFCQTLLLIIILWYAYPAFALSQYNERRFVAHLLAFKKIHEVK